MPKKKRSAIIGNCKLTGVKGPFVKSHIYPQAYTRPTIAGSHLIEAGQNQRPVKRFTSWFDDQIVTREGEDVLARYDNGALNELVRLKLVWRSWGPMQVLSAKDHHRLDEIYGARAIGDCDTDILRLFFLSLLWRAAVSNRPECTQIKLHPTELSKLTQMIREGDPGDPTCFPINLVQLSTRHVVHSMAPTFFEKRVPKMDELNPNSQNFDRTIPGYRFYIDGLVIHIHRNSEPEHRASEDKQEYPMILGNCRRLVVITMPFEASFQSETLQAGIEKDYRDWPQVMAALMGPQD